MRNALRYRAVWLLPYAAAGVLTFTLVQRSLGADDPRDWLDKMNQALATRNYDGTFFHLSEGRVETMRIVHRVKAGLVTERLQSLDGSGREFVRNNDELTCYLPDQHTVLVEPRQVRGPFLGSLPRFGSDVDQFYLIESLAGFSRPRARPRASLRSIPRISTGSVTAYGSIRRPPCRSRPNCAMRMGRSSSKSCSPASTCPRPSPTPI